MANYLDINGELGPLYTIQVVQYESVLNTEFNPSTKAPFEIVTDSPPQQKLTLTMESPVPGAVLPSISVGPDLSSQRNLNVLIGTVQPGETTPTFGMVINQPVRQMFSLVVAPVKFTATPSGDAVPTFETISKNLAAIASTLTYSGSQVISQTFANGIIKTFGYGGPGGLPNTITLSGAVPSGIALVKTISYTGTKPTGVAYS